MAKLELEWQDKGFLFGATINERRAFRLERTKAGSLRIVMVARNSSNETWEPILIRATFTGQAAYEKWMNSKYKMFNIDAKLAIEEPEKILSLLLEDSMRY